MVEARVARAKIATDDFMLKVGSSSDLGCDRGLLG